jgi:hypothetical protein
LGEPNQMLPERFAALVNLAGFVAALTLYAMLLVMVVRNPRAAIMSPLEEKNGGTSRRLRFHGREPLLLLTAVLGLSWNLGALVIYSLQDFGLASWPPLVAAIAFASLGFLPAVVVHGALRLALAERRDRWAGAIVLAGYSLSTLAACLQIAALLRSRSLPSTPALRLLTAGFVLVIVLLAIHARRRRALSLAALAVFAVSALHLAGHEASHDSWMIELAGHHSSLPLALAILYQDYPFALADLFLKRALVLLLVTALLLAAYAAVAARLAPAAPDLLAAVALIALGSCVAFLYPALRRGVHWFVDVVVLRRPDYPSLLASIAQAVAGADAPETVVGKACSLLAPALAARRVSCWRLDGKEAVEVSDGPSFGSPTPAPVTAALAEFDVSGHAQIVQSESKKTAAVVVVPTAEPPRYALALGGLAGGRRLLSDDIAMLHGVARTVAHRIDVIRLTRERCEQRLREAEIRQLATEAELRALRAQINPHFLFNALTTVGYLIQTSPERALEKLVQLTELLRRVLRSEREFTTLGKELELVRLYLDLEHARFEERLRVAIDVPRSLHDIPVPAFVLQPIVENAIKHGIAPAADGGLVEIVARAEAGDAGACAPTLRITVRDIGPGRKRPAAGLPGIGLRNLEQRLRHHYGENASIRLEASEQRGTVVTLRLPAMAGFPARPAATGAE